MSVKRSSSEIDDLPVVPIPTSQTLLERLDAYDPVADGTPPPSPDQSDYSPSSTPTPSPKKKKTAASSSASTPKKAKPQGPKGSPRGKKSTASTPTKSPSAGDGQSPKSKYALMVWEAGLKALDKIEVKNEVSNVVRDDIWLEADVYIDGIVARPAERYDPT